MSTRPCAKTPDPDTRGSSRPHTRACTGVRWKGTDGSAGEEGPSLQRPDPAGLLCAGGEVLVGGIAALLQRQSVWGRDGHPRVSHLPGEDLRGPLGRPAPLADDEQAADEG